MNKVAFQFPGQGSQRAGMGKSLLVNYSPIVEPIFRQADNILGYSISQFCCEADDDTLRSTEITQPAIFITSIAALEVLRNNGVQPSFVGGHSLGEYAALVAAGVLKWQEALPLVQLRGQLMSEVGRLTPGAMVASVQVPLDLVELWCEQAAEETSGVLEIANDNGAGQIVVAGTIAAAARFKDLLESAAIEDSRAVQLKVNAPFHCSLMAPIEDEFAVALEKTTFADPEVVLVANSTGDRVRTGAEASKALRAQITGTVRWRESLEFFAAQGVEAFVEVGPGKVLSGICRRAFPAVPSFNSFDPRYISKAVDRLSTTIPEMTRK